MLLSRPVLTAVSLLTLLVPVFAQSSGDAASSGASADSLEGGTALRATSPGIALDSYAWREVGPYRGGRSAAVTGVPGHRDLYYMGAAGGGVWKTVDGGGSWDNVSDGFFGGSIGSVAVSAWDPNVVYVGGGEVTVRGNVSHGDGVYKSTDAGRTWKHMGLPESRRIPRMRIHPKNSEIVYAAVLGHLFGPSDERGVFRSKDGGETWKKILFVSAEVGACDLAMDPTNPRILYATTWRVKRTPYSLDSGGEGSGLWKTTDGGDHWTEITSNEGLPAAPIGISGITVSASDPDNIYAIIEAAEGGVFRSRDAGKTWKKTNSERSLRQRAWYYSRIEADPNDANSVYVMNVSFHHSKDGGKTFGRISVPHGDNHDLWIDPADSMRLIEANDGGANVSYDGGKTWSRQDNQPTAQMYRVSVDSAFPYRLLGGQQDNSAVRIRSRSLRSSSIGVRDWEPTAGGESGHIVAKPGDPDVIFGGSYDGYLTRYNHKTGESRSVNVWPNNPMGWGAEDLRYRFQWNFPIFFSPHDPNTIYAAGNALFRSRNGGASWDAISGDLTRNDKARQKSSGGPITQDNTSVEYYCTIFAALESPQQKGVFWCGSDDGLIHLSRDDGKTWANVTPKGLPEWALINSIEAHPFEAGGLYVAATRYKSDDFAPYLYKTTDWGETWTLITKGIDPLHFTRVIRADPKRRGLLYCGTERGVYLSMDDGASWQSLQLNLPIVPVTDLALKYEDLIVATQGRGYWILDDMSVLHQHSEQVRSEPMHLFAPRTTMRLNARRAKEPRGNGTNPHFGVVIRYQLNQEVPADAAFRLDIADASGRTIRSAVRKPAKKGGKPPEKAGKNHRGEDRRLLTSDLGLNQFVWDLRYEPAEKFEKMIVWAGSMTGPRALPGIYTAKLTVGKTVREVPFEIVGDPRSSATPEELREQFEFLLSTRDTLTETHRAIRRIRDFRTQFAGLKRACADLEKTEGLEQLLESTGNEMTAIEEALYQTKNRSRQDPLNFPIRLNDKLAGVMSSASTGDYPPTAQVKLVRKLLTDAIEQQLESLKTVWSERLPQINRLARELEIPAIR